MRRFKLELIAGLAISLSFATSAESHAAAARTAWRIDYDAGLVTGRTQVFASPDAVKIETGLYEIIARGPAWSATIVNRKTKRICELTAERWQKDGFFIEPHAPGYMAPEAALSNEKLKYSGMPARKMTWKTVESDDFFQERSKPKKGIITLIQDDGGVPMSKMQLKLLSAWYGCPSITGIPLYWVNNLTDPKTKKSEIRVRLKANGIGKVPINSVSWQSIKGCKPEKNLMNLVDNRITNTITDFVEVEDELSRAKNKSK